MIDFLHGMQESPCFELVTTRSKFFIVISNHNILLSVYKFYEINPTSEVEFLAIVLLEKNGYVRFRGKMVIYKMEQMKKVYCQMKNGHETHMSSTTC
jgi:hypothetical protein